MDEMLYCVKIQDRSGSFNLAAEMLASLELDFSSWEDRESLQVVHTVYALDPTTAKENLLRIQETATNWKPLGLKLGEIEYFEMKKEDWSEVWKKFFPLLPISERLIVKPSWLECNPRPGQKILEINPGMSFGTGQHATTLFCLKAIDKLAGKPGMHSFLDAGCGSGILAIASVLLGFDTVDAFDYDPDAVLSAKENLALNHIKTVDPQVADAALYTVTRPEKYDLVCANILAHLLKAYRPNISSWVRPGGYLALAGILEPEFEEVSKLYCEIGFEEIERETLREWTSGLFRKN